MRSAVVRLLTTLTLLAWSPAAASADWLITGYAGMSWAGKATFNDVIGVFERKPDPRFNFGVSFDSDRRGVLGYGVDFGFYPEFFGGTSGTLFEFGSSRLITLMANVNVGLPGDRRWLGVRPYAAAGAGLLNASVSDPDVFDATSTTFGFNAGGGFTLPLGDKLGLQADVRYFRSLQSKEPTDDNIVTLDSLQFWRAAAGISFRF
jgi:hypothetical protein